MFDGMKLDLGRSAEPIKRMSLSGQINMLKVDG
jgi:hypothetical protein